MLVFSVATSAVASSVPAGTPLRNLVDRYTTKRTEGTPSAPGGLQSVAEPTPAPAAPETPVPAAQRVGEPAATAGRPVLATTAGGGRKSSPPLASLPPPKATGPLRILLVDDDESANNVGGNTGVAQRSDEIFRELVAKAVGGRSDAWAVDVVRSRDNGPGLDRLRSFNLVIWYTGASFGSGNDTIGRDDEKTLRRYLEETGGSVVLISAGYVNNLVYGQSWSAAEHPFLKEVLAVNGCYGLAQRGAGGSVIAHDGAQYPVEHPGATTALFSVVNPDGAALVFTSPIRTSYVNQEGDLPVAVANAFGQGRIVYAGFTVENIPDADRAKAFGTLLAAAGVSVDSGRSTRGPAVATEATPSATAGTPGAVTVVNSGSPATATTASSSSAATGVPTVLPVRARISESGKQTIKQPAAGPAPAGLRVNSISVGVQSIHWSIVTGATYDVYRQDGQNWTPVATGLTRGLTEDRKIVPPGTVYRVSAHYADGSVGHADVTHANPFQPSRPTRLQAQQIAPNALRLTFWSANDVGLQGYRVFASTAPNAGKFVATRNAEYSTVDIEGLPVGAVLLRLVPQFDGKLASIEEQLNASVVPWSGRYRVVLLGFRVAKQTPDEDILGGDGAGDEVFFGAFRALVPRQTGDMQVQGVVRSAVFGDNSRFPARVRAGSATPSGGLRSGDVIPSDAQMVAQPGLATSADRLPMLLWEGRLDHGGNLLALGLVGFEWDNTTEANWNSWQGWWTSADGMRLVPVRTRDRIGFLETTIINPKWFAAMERIDFVPTPGANRPLSVTYAFLPGTVTARWRHAPQGIVLSQENIDATLRGRAAITLGVEWRTDGNRDSNSAVDSQYVLYLQIERLGD